MMEEEKEDWKTILALLKDQFPDILFLVEKQERGKWCLYCNDYFFYITEEFKNTLSFIRENFPALSFYSCVIYRMTAKILRERKTYIVIE